MAITTSGSSITLSITVGPSVNAVLRVNLVAGPRPLAEYSTLFLIHLHSAHARAKGRPHLWMSRSRSATTRGGKGHG